MTQQQSSAAPAIVADALVKRYPGDVVALDGVSFAVEPGGVFGLLGPNGAGKSTTVRILTTLARPDAGTASVAGIDVVRDPVAVRRTIGSVGQRAAVDPEATGRENLVLEARIHDLGGAAMRSRVDELLARFGLTEAAGRMTKTYSAGCCASSTWRWASSIDQSVLFLDEPTTGLDPEARAELWSEIGRLTREDGPTILLTTHYLEEADRLADRLAIVDHGRIVARGRPTSSRPSSTAMPSSSSSTRPPPASGRPVVDRHRRAHQPVVDGRTLRARADPGAPPGPGRRLRAGYGGDRGRLDHRRAAVARRRLPAATPGGPSISRSEESFA